MGSLDRVWPDVPADSGAEAFENAFQRHFGASRAGVLDAVDMSFAYNAANDAYFAVRDIRPVGNLTVEELLKKKGSGRVKNVIAS